MTLSVRDNHGGLGENETQVTVLNVPPTVDPGPPVFSYPETVITLQGSFTDPGWLDTHEGNWNFGDGSRPVPATITEQHNRP